MTPDGREDSLKVRSMELPRSVVIGHAAVEQAGDVCRRLNLGRRALLVEDPTTRKIAGERVAASLAEAGLEAQHHLIEDATIQEAEFVRGVLTEQRADVVLGVGGGRPIDVAKYASHLQGIPFVSVPTAASHDGLVSSVASLAGDEGKRSHRAQAPLAVIMDTEVIAASPYRLLAAGCGDIVANSTAVKDWVLAHNLRNEDFSSYAYSLSEMTARLMIDHAGDVKPGLEDSAWFVCKALVSSGVAMSIAGSSRPASGSEHLFSHALDRNAKRPALHGEQCGVGTILMMYLHGGDWARIRDALETIGAPTTAKELGVTDQEVIEALVHAHEVRPERYTILGDRGLTHEAAERLASATDIL